MPVVKTTSPSHCFAAPKDRPGNTPPSANTKYASSNCPRPSPSRAVPIQCREDGGARSRKRGRQGAPRVCEGAFVLGGRVSRPNHYPQITPLRHSASFLVGAPLVGAPTKN